jgi:hypothetical protein
MRIKIRLLFPLIIIAMVPNALMAQGTNAFDFLRLPVSARAAGLGNTYLNGMDDPSVIFTNPGAISSLKSMQASAGFIKHVMDVNAGYAALGMKIDSIGTFSAGIFYMNYGSMDRTDNLGNKNGTFSAGDFCFTAGYGNNYEDLLYGGSVKFIYSSIDGTSATGLAIDAGVCYLIPKQEMSIGLSLLNMGAQLSKFGKESDPLPFEINVGVSKKLEHLPLSLHLVFHKLNEDKSEFFDRLSSFSIGGEVMFSKYFRGRLGFNNETRKEMKIGSSAGLAGFSLGFGIYLKRYVIDYSYTSWGKVGELHRIGVNLLFEE